MRATPPKPPPALPFEPGPAPAERARVIDRLLGALLDWLLDDFRHVVIAGLVALVIVLWFVTIADLKSDVATQTARADREAQNADDWMASADAWEAEFNAFVIDIVAKQRAAAEADRANIARVEAEYAAARQKRLEQLEERADLAWDAAEETALDGMARDAQAEVQQDGSNRKTTEQAEAA